MLNGCISLGHLTKTNESYEYMSSLIVEGDNGVWSKGNYVDEFGLPTNKS